MIDFSVKLEGRAKSRLKFNSLIFIPYDHQKLMEILCYKYPNARQIFTPDALQLICKKVANTNSDVRLL